jgi:LysM repeat protein
MLRIATYIVLLFILLLIFSSLKIGSTVRASPIFWDNPSTEYRTIKARSGDTLKKIAQRLDIPVAELVRLNGLSENTRLPRGTRIQAPIPAAAPNTDAEIVSNRITLSDGYSFEADEVWKNGDEIWFRKGKISQRLEKPVSSVKPVMKASEPPVDSPLQASKTSKPLVAEATPNIWIHLVGGARFRVDEVQETGDGAWYTRANLSIFMERNRIARIERELPGAAGGASRNRDWTSGNAWIDGLIKTNGDRHGLDPYLVFLVIEQESQFRQRAVSPKGARGLMQLMPGTARRLGVRDSFDPAQNIMGGSRYLKELMNMFGGRVDLALASYNAGEGAVMKYGRAVPPYRETRDYVKKITKRYGHLENAKKDGKPPDASPAP